MHTQWSIFDELAGLKLNPINDIKTYRLFFCHPPSSKKRCTVSVDSVPRVAPSPRPNSVSACFFFVIVFSLHFNCDSHYSALLASLVRLLIQFTIGIKLFTLVTILIRVQSFCLTLRLLNYAIRGLLSVRYDYKCYT